MSENSHTIGLIQAKKRGHHFHVVATKLITKEEILEKLKNIFGEEEEGVYKETLALIPEKIENSPALELQKYCWENAIFEESVLENANEKEIYIELDWAQIVQLCEMQFNQEKDIFEVERASLIYLVSPKTGKTFKVRIFATKDQKLKKIVEPVYPKNKIFEGRSAIFKRI